MKEFILALLLASLPGATGDPAQLQSITDGDPATKVPPQTYTNADGFSKSCALLKGTIDVRPFDNFCLFHSASYTLNDQASFFISVADQGSGFLRPDQVTATFVIRASGTTPVSSGIVFLGGSERMPINRVDRRDMPVSNGDPVTFFSFQMDVDTLAKLLVNDDLSVRVNNSALTLPPDFRRYFLRVLQLFSTLPQTEFQRQREQVTNQATLNSK